MEGESLLLTIAQLGLTLVGFSALILAFRRRDRTWKPSEVVGQKVILELSLATTLLALLPQALFYTLGSEVVWRISSGIYVVFVVGWIVIVSRRSQHMERGAQNIRVGVLTETLLVIIVLLEIGNVLTWNSFSPYLWGLLWMVLVAGLQFIIFVYDYLGETIGKDE